MHRVLGWCIAFGGIFTCTDRPGLMIAREIPQQCVLDRTGLEEPVLAKKQRETTQHRLFHGGVQERTHPQ